jgi:hypothetical protein
VVGFNNALFFVILSAGEKQHPKKISIQYLRDFHNSLPLALKFLKDLE